MVAHSASTSCKMSAFFCLGFYNGDVNEFPPERAGVTRQLSSAGFTGSVELALSQVGIKDTDRLFYFLWKPRQCWHGATVCLDGG